jgi:hypothetical protein
MDGDLLTPRDAARQLGISVTTLYAWLGLVRVGEFELHGQPVTIRFMQSGRRGQGRIRIAVAEIERLKDLMVVRPRSATVRRSPVRRDAYPFITAPLGRPSR